MFTSSTEIIQLSFPGDSAMRIQKEHTFILHTVAEITEKLALEEA